MNCVAWVQLRARGIRSEYPLPALRGERDGGLDPAYGLALTLFFMNTATVPGTIVARSYSVYPRLA